MKKFFYTLTIVILFVSFWACEESDNFSADPNLKISFSRDTVRFDTVFTTVGSATRIFKVHNRNNKSLVISSIEVMNPQTSGFKMNIDGESGTRLTNVDILKKDSLYGFIEVKVNPQHVNNPVVIRDSIRFETNGNVQYVQLEAVGQDVHLWIDKKITTDTVLTADKPFLIYGALEVEDGKKLEIKENVQLYFHNKASLQVGGSLVAEGEIGKPVIFRGDRLDKMNGNVPFDNVPGQWNGIVFHANSFDNNLKNVIVRNTVEGLSFQSSNPSRKKATLENVVIQNSLDNGIKASNCYIEASNCLFSNSRLASLFLSGGKYSFLHCTIANYYRWTIRQSEAVVINNIDKDGQSVPLLQCDFVNSIIYGSNQNELRLDGNNLSANNYKFVNCLIRNTELVNPNFVNTVWNKNPQFTYINDEGDYNYDFRLQEASPAIGVADKSYSLSLPLDLKGDSRLNDANPDAGCYEWVGE